ncbi:MAG: alpha/beta fold hydrolase [Coriobacteriales bacterium]|jgi:alpha-beta hydrolase superfamily lysophospholipase
MSEFTLNHEGLDIGKRQFTYPSCDGTVDISAWIWTPAPDGDGSPHPIGIVQIVHGMLEHIGRYDDMARTLAANGYIVVGNDHRAHGDSVKSPEDRGVMPLKGGDRIWIEDVHQLRKLVTEELGTELPYFMLGHSMGSFITRAYLAQPAKATGLAGAIIEGTGNPPNAAGKIGKILAGVEGKTRGDRYRDRLVTRMVIGPYVRSVENPRTPNDWLSRDDAVVDAYRADPLCRFRFATGAFKSLFSLVIFTSSQASADALPKDLPILIASGECDPVGDMGKAPRLFKKMCDKAGVADVELKMYEGARHELHNELNQDEFKTDVLDWLARHI